MDELYTLLKQRVDERVQNDLMRRLGPHEPVSLRKAFLFFVGAVAVAAIYMGVVLCYEAIGAVMGV